MTGVTGHSTTMVDTREERGVTDEYDIESDDGLTKVTQVNVDGGGSTLEAAPTFNLTTAPNIIDVQRDIGERTSKPSSR